MTLLFVTLWFSAVAMAAKPSPPLQISCTTISQSGMVYRAQCDLTAVGSGEPESVQLMPMKGKAVKLLESSRPDGPSGTGRWLLTIEFMRPMAASLRFKATYPNRSVIQVGVVYNPFKTIEAVKPKKGRVVTDSKGERVQEFPSK